MLNPHEILGVQPDADFDTIKQAYLKLAKKAHPDAGGDKETFVQLHAAFEVMVGVYESGTSYAPGPSAAEPAEAGSRETRSGSSPSDEQAAAADAPPKSPSKTYEDIVRGVWERLDRESVQPRYRRDIRCPPSTSGTRSSSHRSAPERSPLAFVTMDSCQYEHTGLLSLSSRWLHSSTLVACPPY